MLFDYTILKYYFKKKQDFPNPLSNMENKKRFTKMFQNKKQIKITILLLLTIIVISQFSLSPLAKTEVYPACACTHADRFSLSDNPYTLSTTSLKPEVRKININSASQGELTSILQISKPPARKIVTLKDSLSGGFKEPKDLLQFTEITDLEWQEWEEEGIMITVSYLQSET